MTVLERNNDWAPVRCSNGWEAWTNAAALVPNRPEILDVLSQSLITYRRLVDDLADGRLDQEALRQQALAVSLVVPHDAPRWLWIIPAWWPPAWTTGCWTRRP